MNLYKDYQLIGNILVKMKMSENAHLLHSKGSVPCIDKSLFDTEKGNFKYIRFQTDKGRVFKCSKETFEKNKEEIDLGYGKQYWIPKEKWEIIQLNSGVTSQEKLPF